MNEPADNGAAAVAADMEASAAARRIAAKNRMVSRIAFAVSCAFAAAAGVWTHGLALAAIDCGRDEPPAAMAGRENSLDAYRRSAYRLWCRLSLSPDALAEMECFKTSAAGDAGGKDVEEGKQEEMDR